MSGRFSLILKESNEHITLSIVPIQPFKVCKHDAFLLASMLSQAAKKIETLSSEEFKDALNLTNVEFDLDAETLEEDYLTRNVNY